MWSKWRHCLSKRVLLVQEGHLQRDCSIHFPSRNCACRILTFTTVDCLIRDLIAKLEAAIDAALAEQVKEAKA
jgi:hypothetical protein